MADDGERPGDPGSSGLDDPRSAATEDHGISARARLIVIGVALLVAGFLIGRLTAPDSDSPVAAVAPAEGAPSNTFPAGDQNREGFWGFVDYKRLAADTFDRPDNRDTLGDAGTGEPWQAVSGTWGIERNAARLVVSDPEQPNLAILPAPDGDALVEVTMAVPEDGAGLAFRYVDPSNYWAVTTNPSLGTWSVSRTVDGAAEIIGELRAPSSAGTTITITLSGARLRFLVDAVEQLTLDDETFAGRRYAGLIAPAGSTFQARWERFLTMTPPRSGSSSDPGSDVTAE